jgi:hypothetical protein
MSTTQQKHTPGPWAVDYAMGIRGPNGERIAYVIADSSADPTPDARLIAAAPDLLDALKETAGCLAAWNERQRSEEPTATDIVISHARAAILKAEGGQP